MKAVSYFDEKITNKKRIVLVGGCFDILHDGHIKFLQSAKAVGDILVVLLESDLSIKEHKGDNRPRNNQEKRAEELVSHTETDIVITLPYPFFDNDYDSLVSKLKPAIIATTAADQFKHHKERQAHLIGARVLEVIRRLPEHSTTKLLKGYE